MIIYELGCYEGTHRLGASRTEVGPRRYIKQPQAMGCVYTDSNPKRLGEEQARVLCLFSFVQDYDRF
jgi:hypothetical protein